MPAKKYFISLLLSMYTAAWAQPAQWLNRSWDIFGADMDSAIILCEKAYYQAQQQGDIKNMGRAMSYRAIYFDIAGKTDSALFLFNKAIDIQESVKDTMNLVTTYNNMGIFYFSQYQYTRASVFYKKAYNQAMLIGDYGSAAGSLVNLGIIESYQPMGGNALKYYAEAEQLYMREGDSLALGPIWSNTAKVYYDQKKYTEAFQFINRSMAQDDTTLYAPNRITDRVLLSNILIGLKQYNEASRYAHEALQLSFTGEFPERRQYVYDVLAKLYYETGDYKQAYHYVNQYRDLRDSLINDSKATQIAAMEATYEVEHKNNQITQLSLQAEKAKNLSLQRDRLEWRFYIILLASVVALIIFVVLIFLLMNNLKLEKQNSQLLAEKNRISESLLEKEKILMKESHHRIKNNLQLINSILDLQARNIHDETAREAIKESKQRIQAISFAHHRLYATDTVEKINLKDFITELVMSIRDSTLDKNSGIRIETDIVDAFSTTELAIPMGLIINELFTNALKYAFPTPAQGTIHIRLAWQQTNLVLVIGDNGRGWNGEITGTGFGHKLVNSMVRQIKATYTLQTQQGVTHTFVIPYQAIT